MEFNENKKAAFLLLKGVCNGIVKNPCKEHPEQLNQVLNAVGDKLVEEFIDYILYPIKLQIFNKDLDKRDDTTCILLDCLYQVLQHLKFSVENLFLDIYSLICFSMVKGSGSPEVAVKESSEELKLKSLKNAKLLFSQAEDELLDSLYKQNEFYSKLCVLVYNSLQFASKQKSIALRCLALESLLVFCRLNDLNISGDSKFSIDSAKVVKKCLPGVITECRAIISEGHTQNHQITVLVLKLWSRSISLAMADCHNVRNNESIQDLFGNFSAESKLAETSTCSINDNELLKSEEFSEQWIRVAAKRLSSATDVFTMLKLHPHFKVRKQLVSCVTLILSYAPLNMSPSLGSLLDALIVLSEDSDESVSKASLQALGRFKTAWTKNRGRQLAEDVKDCFCSLLNRLPRILHGTDDNLKESDMTLLCGYILLLGQDNFADFVTSQQLWDKLINCLLEAATLDTSNISLIEEPAIRDLEATPCGAVPWRNLIICTTPKLRAQLERVFQILSTMPNLIDISFALLDIFNNSPLKRLEITLSINDIVLSSQQIVDKKYSHIVKTIVNEYLEPYFWDQKTQPVLSEAKKLGMQTCLCIEGIGKLAKSLGPDHFSQYLFKGLFPLLEYAGSPYSCIAQAGIASVRDIAAVYNGSVGSLIQNNVDYLSHHISVKLRQVDKQVTVLYVLSAVMNHSDMDTLPSLLEIINNILFQSFDRFQSNNLNAYLHVFKTFLNCLHSWLDKKEDIVEPEEEKSLIEMILAYQEMKNILDNFSNPNDDVTETEEADPKETDPKETPEMAKEDEDLEGKKKNIPNYIKLTEAIMLRSSHFLPSKDVNQQNNSMQILEKGSLILMDYQDILLPVVHKIWSPLVERFEPTKDPLTVKNAFSLLTALAYTSKDFIRQRSLKQVLPKLCTILEGLSAESKLKHRVHSYRYSQKYKLQISLLEGLGDLAVNIELAGKEIFTLLTTCQVYLSSTQPQPLQEACIDLYTKLSKLNRGMVWLHLMSLWPRNNYFEEAADFQLKTPIPVNKDNEHFKKNVDTLLDMFHNEPC